MTARLLILCPGQHGQAAGSALAAWQALSAHAPVPALVAGYGDGELYAWSAAGALAPGDAVQLAGARARAMRRCLSTYPGQAMAEVSGLRVQRVGELVASDLFHVAIETGDASCVIGGPAAGLAAVEEKIALLGGRVVHSPLDMAAHTPYMAPAVAPFAAALRGTAFQPQTAPVLSGISAEAIEGKAGAIEHLSRQLAEKILWADCMDACAGAAVTVALELGPGVALSRLLKARHPAIVCRAVADFSDLDGVRHWLSSHLD